MKNKILAILCVALIAVLGFASCEQETACEHTFSAKWSTNETNHWHAATCEHGEIKGQNAAHTDADENGKCDVCEYEVGHTHAFADEWSSDEENHWKAATCTHTDEKGELSLHKDENTDASCDVCDAHVHILDEIGICGICNKITQPIDENDMLKVVTALRSRKSLVQSGKVEYKVDITSSVTGTVVDSRWHNVDYLFGTNGSYYKRCEDEIRVIGERDNAVAEKTGKTLVKEDWLELLANGEVESVVAHSVDGVYLSAEPTSSSLDDLAGYYYAVSTLTEGYGAEQVLFNLYELSLHDRAENRVASNNGEVNSGSLSYDILVINTDVAEGEDDNVNFYRVEVKYTYDDDFVLTALDLKVDCYTNSLEDSAEHDYTYDQKNKTITMKPNASADTYTFKVVQQKGNRDSIDLKTKADFTPTEIILSDKADATEDASNITVTVGDFAKPIYILGAPGTFTSFLKGMNIRVLNQYGRVSQSGLQAYYYEGTISLTPTVAGEYVIEVTTGNIKKTVNVIVENQNLRGDYTIELTATDNNVWVGPYRFTAEVAGTYTFYCPTYGVGIWEKSSKDAYTHDSGYAPYVDYNSGDSESQFTVELEAGEVFSFYYMLVEKNVVMTIKYSIS